MVAILAIVAVLVVIAIAAGALSRRRAAERAAVDQERRVIAGELSEQRRAQDARTARAAEPRFERPREAAPRGPR
jgi:hypothetical protein